MIWLKSTHLKLYVCVKNSENLKFGVRGIKRKGTSQFAKLLSVSEHIRAGILSFTISPPLTSAHKVKKKSLSQHHLAGSQHAAPAAIRGQSRARQRGKILPVRQPNSGPEVPAEVLHITHNTFLIRGLRAGFRLIVIL